MSRIENDSPARHDNAEVRDLEALVAATARQIRRQAANPLQPGLHVVATPIGNLADVTLRALTTLAAVDVIYCEDTRHSRTLLTHYGLNVPLRPYHEHNAESERPRILAALAEGRRVALVSDAGTPLVSDPGYKLVRDVVEAGHRVWSLPGPSAALAALTSAGLPSDCFLFAGFLPPRSAARRTRIAELALVDATLVLFEAPGRLGEALADLAASLGDRPAAVLRELTKLHEEVVRAPLQDLAGLAAARDWRGEIVVVIGPGEASVATDAEILARLETALASHSVRDAARIVGDTLGVARGRAYELALKLRKDASS